MNIAILSRGPSLFSTQALYQEGLRRGHRMQIIDFMSCSIVVEKDSPQLYHQNQALTNFDGIIPRIGSSVTFYGSAVIQQFEMMNTYTALGSETLLKSRNKLRCLQLLSMSNIGMPKTVFTNPYQDAASVLNAAGGVPVVIKLLKGTHGLGVILSKDFNVAESVIEAFNKLGERVIVQEFIKESSGRDLRAFVVGDRVVAAMRRQAKDGEFRSNLHRGGSSLAVKLTDEEERTALAASKALGLKVAGVDMLESNRGPLVLEVNPSPGLEGISNTTGVNVAGEIISFLEKEIKEHQGQNPIISS